MSTCVKCGTLIGASETACTDHLEESFKIGAAARLVQSKDWSSEVTEKVKNHTSEGLFTKSAGAIAEGLKSQHKDLQSAMGALNFYVNRAGANLSNADKAKMGQAKKRLHDMFGGAK